MWRKNRCIPHGWNISPSPSRNGRKISSSFEQTPISSKMPVSYNVVLSDDAPKIPKNTKSEPGRTRQSPRHAGGPETCGIPTGAPKDLGSLDPWALRSGLLSTKTRGKQGPKANSKWSPSEPCFASKRLPGECLRSWNSIHIGPDNPTFNSSQLSQAQLNLLNIQSSSCRSGLKLAPLRLQIQSYAVRFAACHLFDANLHCIQVQNVWFLNALAN